MGRALGALLFTKLSKWGEEGDKRTTGGQRPQVTNLLIPQLQVNNSLL